MPEQPKRRGGRWNPTRVVNYVVSIVSVLLVVIAVYRALPPSRITIETGPIGGSYYNDALQYKRALQSRGITVDLRPDPDSLEIVNHVEAAANHVRIGFIAQKVDRADFPNTVSLGAIELQPLFIFYSVKLGEIGTPDSLRGRRIVMPPERSATSEAALNLLRHYDVTPENSMVTFLPIAEAVRALHEGRFDAGFFMLTPRNEFVTSLVADRNLRLLDLRDTVALSRLEPYLRPVVLPRGIYDVESDVPPDDVHMLAATVNVVARKDAPAAVLYPLLAAMADVHHHSSLINNAGDFPNLIDISLPADPLATQYEKSGMPWIYRTLPLWLASLIDSYFVIGVILVLVVELYRSFRYLMELIDFLFEHMWLRILLRIERHSRDGGQLGRIDRKLVDVAESALFRTSRRRRSEELIGRIRQKGQ